MTIYSKLSIDSKPKKSTKMSVIYKLQVRMTKKRNQHIAGVYVNIHTKYHYVCGQESKSRKSTKIAAI